MTSMMAAQVGPLLDQVVRLVACFTGDGAFDRDDVYGEVAFRVVSAQPHADLKPTAGDQRAICAIMGISSSATSGSKAASGIISNKADGAC